jgi:hypothetical protein
MIDQETVWREIWPVVEDLIQATLAEERQGIKRLLVPGQPAAVLYDLFGLLVLDILLKTVLGRERLGLARAIETENGRYVHIEYAWPDPAVTDASYSAVDVVSVQMQHYRQQWRVVDINPANTDLPMTEARAQTILLANQMDELEPWIIPVALFAGALPLPLQPSALQDPVERLFLPGLQQRTFGVVSLVGGRRLWRDFLKKAKPELSQPAAWAAAVEWIMNEQTLREVTQAAVGQHYQVGLPAMLPRIRQIKEWLKIQGLDERYSPLGTTRVVLPDREQPAP